MIPKSSIIVLVLAFLIDFKIVKCKTIEISSYSQIANAGISPDSANEATGNGVKIYKSSLSDLPDSLSVDESEATGRAFPNHNTYRMPFVGPGLPRPRAPGRSGPPVIVYPVYKPPPQNRIEADKLAGNGQAMDRFFPGEAVATNMFKNKNNGYRYPRPQPPAPPPPPKPASPASSQPPLPSGSSFPSPDDYRPPKDLYSFPPNINSTYLPPNKSASNGSPISSYLPPAAGPISSFPAFPGPVNPEYLPSFMKNAPTMNNGSSSMDSGNGMSMSPNGNGGNGAATPTPMAMGNGNGNGDNGHDHDHDHHHHHDYDFDHHGYHYPVPDHNHGDDDDSATTPPPPAPDDSDSGKMMDMNMMNGMGMDGPPDDHDHHHHHHSHPPWDSFPSFYGSHGYDAFPEIIFDHDPHHDHHHMEHMTTTMAPEPPPEPRVKKYSYFYIGRKLWYIPLYFTVWFSFYVAFLILKSIARHTVNIPNHYQNKRSIRHDMSHKEVVEKVDRLTTFVLSQIDDFKEKYSEY